MLSSLVITPSKAAWNTVAFLDDDSVLSNVGGVALKDDAELGLVCRLEVVSLPLESLKDVGVRTLLQLNPIEGLEGDLLHTSLHAHGLVAATDKTNHTTSPSLLINTVAVVRAIAKNHRGPNRRLAILDFDAPGEVRIGAEEFAETTLCNLDSSREMQRRESEKKTGKDKLHLDSALNERKGWFASLLLSGSVLMMGKL